MKYNRKFWFSKYELKQYITKKCQKFKTIFDLYRQKNLTKVLNKLHLQIFEIKQKLKNRLVVNKCTSS